LDFEVFIIKKIRNLLLFLFREIKEGLAFTFDIPMVVATI